MEWGTERGNRLICGLCGRGVEAEKLCGRLLRKNDCVAHLKCMQYSSNLVQYKLSTFGGFLVAEVQAEIKRGKSLKCEACKKAGDTSQTRPNGATCGCAVKKCNATFHYPCAKESAITVRSVDSETKEVIFQVFCSEKHKDQFNKGNTSKLNSSAESGDGVSWHELGERSRTAPRCCCQTSQTEKSCCDNMADDPTSAPSTAGVASANANAWRMKRIRKHKRPRSMSSLDSAWIVPGKQAPTKKKHWPALESDSDLTLHTASIDACGSASFDVSLQSDADSSASGENGSDLPDMRHTSHDDSENYTSDSVDTEDRSQKRKTGNHGHKTRHQGPNIEINKCGTLNASMKSDHLDKFLSNKPAQYASQLQYYALSNNNSSSCPDMSSVDGHMMIDMMKETFPSIETVDQPTVVSLVGQSPQRHKKNRSNSCANQTRTAAVRAPVCHLCHHVGGMKKRTEAFCSQPLQECVLCFIECNRTVLTEQHKCEVQAFANQFYNVVMKHAIIWVPKVDGTPLTSQLLIYLIRDISQVLREHNYLDLERLVFGLSQHDIDAYKSFHHLHQSFGTGRLESIHNLIHGVIKDDLSEAEKGTGVKVGSICKVSQKPVFMFFLRVCDATDPMHRVRSCLCHRHQSIFKWKADTRLANLPTLSARTREYFRQREGEELQSWLERNTEPEISIYEPKLQSAALDQEESAIFQLKEHFQLHYDTSPHGMSTLVFLGPINYTAETAAVYVEQWMPEMLGEVLTSVRDVFVVLGINVSHGTCSLTDLKPPLQGNVHPTVYSFADPVHLPVTCVVLHFEMSS